MISVLVAFLAGGGLGAYAWQALGPGFAPAQDPAAAPSDAPGKPASARIEFELGKTTVALGLPPGERPRYLMIAPVVVFSFTDPKVIDGVEKDPLPGAAAVLRDGFVEYLSQLHLREAEGSAGIVRIRSELLRRARALYPENDVREVLLQDFLVQ
ncbi:flagellar basal body-associated protein FliL [Sulfitobacter aestuarii]|uniref:Flagellar protein FliL n=1 Tax=Sulfitobacter aestuarii TaxID=2161676 RepID=A0ABW5U3M8_9RHOB